MCAAIDKTYLNYEDYLILREWCKNTELVYDNGKIGSPLDYLHLYNDPYKGEAPVWNTPTAFDKWLYYNCPLEFIQKRLKEQYGDNPEFEEAPDCRMGNHYKVITKPKYKWRCKRTWYINIDSPIIYCYGWDSKRLYHNSALFPPETYSVNCIHAKNLTKRKLNRIIKRLRLPIGTKLLISNRWEGTEYMIKIC